MSTKYLLVDGVRYNEALARLYRRAEDIQIEPLYAGTPWQEVADLGPILLEPDQNSPLWKEVAEEPEWHTAAAVLTSDASMTQLADHLRQFNQVTDTQGTTYLLRYADPLVAWFWLKSFGADTPIPILGPINQWQIVQTQPAWQPAATDWHIFNGAISGGDLPCNSFGEAQQRALDQAYRWQLKSRLYTCLQINQPAALQRLAEDSLNDWLDSRLSTAEAWGLSSERSHIIWCVLSLTHGDDFATAANGPYESWLRLHQHTAAFTPDQRLQQYYQTTVEPEGLLT